MQNTQQMQYLKVQVETASPGELTLLLYQEIVKSLLKAKQFYAQKQYDEMNTVLHKVRSIFNELVVTLDFKYEISEDLKDLYLFYSSHIARFIVTKNETLLEETLEFARLMVDTWKQALLIAKTSKGSQMND